MKNWLKQPLQNYKKTNHKTFTNAPRYIPKKVEEKLKTEDTFVTVEMKNMVVQEELLKELGR